LKLGVEHSPSTVRKYMVEDRPPSTTWRGFIERHRTAIWAVDFTTVALWNFDVRHVFVVMALDSRRVVHAAVTASPTLAWVQQQLREAIDERVCAEAPGDVGGWRRARGCGRRSRPACAGRTWTSRAG